MHHQRLYSASIPSFSLQVLTAISLGLPLPQQHTTSVPAKITVTLLFISLQVSFKISSWKSKLFLCSIFFKAHPGLRNLSAVHFLKQLVHFSSYFKNKRMDHLNYG